MPLQPFDRLPVVEWAMWWDETLAAWHTQGFPSNVTDRYDLDRQFGIDPRFEGWLGISGPGCPSPAWHGAGLVADEDDDDRVRACLYPEQAVDTAL